jgi:cytochrome c biogenesis factor
MKNDKDFHGATGGNIWNPKNNSSIFSQKIFLLCKNVSILSILLTMIVAFMISSNYKAIQSKQEGNVFKVVTNFYQGWENPTLFCLYAVFVISMFFLAFVQLTNFNKTKALFRAFVVAGLGLFFLINLVTATTNAGMENHTKETLITWLQEKQDLNLAGTAFNLNYLTRDKGNIMYGNDGKLYVVVLENKSGQIAIKSKTDLSGKPELIKDLK